MAQLGQVPTQVFALHALAEFHKVAGVGVEIAGVQDFVLLAGPAQLLPNHDGTEKARLGLGFDGETELISAHVFFVEVAHQLVFEGQALGAAVFHLPIQLVGGVAHVEAVAAEYGIPQQPVRRRNTFNYQ